MKSKPAPWPAESSEAFSNLAVLERDIHLQAGNQDVEVRLGYVCSQIDSVPLDGKFKPAAKKSLLRSDLDGLIVAVGKQRRIVAGKFAF